MATVPIDLKNHNLTVKQGGGVLIKQGGTIRQITGTLANNQPTTTETETKLVYHHSDHLSGSNAETNEKGEVIEVIDYYPFGEVRLDEKTGGYENDYKYTGKELDQDTELYYYEARYYDARMGRFISVDPVTVQPTKELLIKPQELNSCSYVINNPLKYVDPTGLTTEVDGETGKVMNVKYDDDTSIISYPYIDSKRVQGPGQLIGKSYRVDTFEVGGIIHINEDKTEDFYSMVDKAKGESMISIALKSRSNQEYDLKSKWGDGDPITQEGYLLNGKYATLRDFGNALAGINARVGGVKYDTFQRMSGAVHQGKGKTGIIRAYFGKEYGPAPFFGEVERQYWGSYVGYEYLYNNYSIR